VAAADAADADAAIASRGGDAVTHVQNV